MKYSLPLFAAAVSIVCSASPLQAASIDAVATNDAPNPETVIINTVTTPNNVYLMKNDSGGYRDIGQTFRAPDSGSLSVAGFAFRVAMDAGNAVGVGATAPGAVFTLSIYEFGSATASSPTGDALYVAKGTIPLNIEQGNYLYFNLDTPLEMTAGSYYGVRIGFDSSSPSGERTLRFDRGPEKSYPDGLAFQVTSANGFEAVAIDFALTVYSAPVPEASSAALLGVSGAGLLWGLTRGKSGLFVKH